MFDIGFMEILVVLIVALIVIGPERMPEVARKIGQFMGKTKRFINSMKEDSEISSAMREIHEAVNLDEEKKQLESVTEELQDDFSQMHQEWGIEEEISRPTFGGEEPASYTDSQFNKAPQQPALPDSDQSKKETKTSDTTSSSEKSSVQTDSTPSKETTSITQQEKA
ncbi:Sec-independent protein translocase protein TatB [Hydrogenovibrio kuenenii]|uniref:Sec-independent protein translocase protein TatB n=1 Tax=Hydrogenovibrio kuenenii TaxID=63658 RepID=UPI000464C47E|nr:Sec-independent protein translocase protein TatB [Hydrogenovibrio kuenenii]